MEVRRSDRGSVHRREPVVAGRSGKHWREVSRREGIGLPPEWARTCQARRDHARTPPPHSGNTPRIRATSDSTGMSAGLEAPVSTVHRQATQTSTLVSGSTPRGGCRCPGRVLVPRMSAREEHTTLFRRFRGSREPGGALGDQGHRLMLVGRRPPAGPCRNHGSGRRP